MKSIKLGSVEVETKLLMTNRKHVTIFQPLCIHTQTHNSSMGCNLLSGTEKSFAQKKVNSLPGKFKGPVPWYFSWDTD